MTSVGPFVPSSRKLSPSSRQDILIQRLLLTLEKEPQISSRKRPYPFAAPSSSSPQLSASKIESPLTPIDLHAAWTEVSSIFPLLSYGEESNLLFLALLGFTRTEDTVDKDVLLKSFDSALQEMLWVRTNAREQYGQNALATTSVEVGQNEALKKRRIELPSSTAAPNKVKDLRECDVLPWNVLLRVTLRFAACLAKQIQSKLCAEGNNLPDLKNSVFKDSVEPCVIPATVNSNTTISNTGTITSFTDGNTSTVELSAKYSPDVTTMHWNDIRRELKKRGLGTKGKKLELAERLERHLKEVRVRKEKAVADGEVDETNGVVAKAAPKHAGLVVSETSTTDQKSTDTLVESKPATSSQNHVNFQSSTNTNTSKEESESNLKRIHPIIQSLDIALSELSIILRREQKRRLMDSQQRQKPPHFSSVAKSEGKDPNASIAEKGLRAETTLENCTQQSSIGQHSTASMPIVRDRMICDWINRSRCGPSRYAFTKDVDFVAQNLDLKVLDISVEEWQEKMNTLISYLDEYVGLGHNDNVSVTGKSFAFRSPLSSPMARSPLASPFGKSPLSSSLFSKFSMAPGLSLAEITRAHIKCAFDMEKEAEIHSTISPSKSDGLSSKSRISLPDRCGSSISKSSMKPMRPGISTEEDIDQLEDAYRMALAFANKSGESRHEQMSERIQWRLELIRQQLNVPKDKKPNGNMDGAESYLRLLLRELVQPSDPTVWARLMKDSEEKDISILLRRGRSILVSFLIEIHAPGWEDALSLLDPSPLADYLGFLSSRDETTTLPEQENEIYLRSSYILPSDGNTESMPSPPVVTEIGLGSCVTNFVQKECNAHTHAIGFVFNRRAGPGSLAERDPFLESIAIALPDVSTLTRDLFDLTLRLAANDDTEHENKPLPLRLATLSASDSLDVVLDVVSDHSQWLEPRAVSRRYQCVIEMILLSFGCFTVYKSALGDGGKIDETWEMRASSLIKVAKTVQNRARIAVYATHFMMILCSKKPHPGQCTFGSRPNFYNVLQLHKFSRFWNEVEEAAHFKDTSIMAQVFDKAFCIKYLLPLSHHCSMLLTKVSYRPSVVGRRSPVSKHEESALSLLTLLCSVFSLLAEDDLLVDCIHVGSSIEVLSLSISFFTSRDKLTLMHSLPTENSFWRQVLDHLTKLYQDVWGDLRSDFWAGKSQSLVSPRTTPFFLVESKNGTVRTMRLMPSFDTLVGSLLHFTSNASLSESVESSKCWSKFVSAFLLNHYAQALPFNAVALAWIRSLASALTHDVLRQKVLEHRLSSKKVNSGNDALTELILHQLMNPLLKSLHSTILRQHARRTSSLRKTSNDMVAITYAQVFKEESARILTKPSPRKTRTWHIFRACIDKMFFSTPPSALFTSLGYSFLTESSAGALRDVWEHYCESHCVHIMVAAGLHVNESVNNIQYSNNQGISANFKALYDAFTSQSKECITRTFSCFALSTKQSSDALELDYYEFAHRVGRDLTSNSAEAGVLWWNELTSGLTSLLAGAKKRTIDEGKRASGDKPVSGRRRKIAHVFSSLELSLSAISHSA